MNSFVKYVHQYLRGEVDVYKNPYNDNRKPLKGRQAATYTARILNKKFLHNLMREYGPRTSFDVYGHINYSCNYDHSSNSVVIKVGNTKKDRTGVASHIHHLLTTVAQVTNGLVVGSLVVHTSGDWHRHQIRKDMESYVDFEIHLDIDQLFGAIEPSQDMKEPHISVSTPSIEDAFKVLNDEYNRLSGELSSISKEIDVLTTKEKVLKEKLMEFKSKYTNFGE
ncbi:hypothetical protein [Aeromonas phage AS-yj]|uniref:Uncharacterized protein n=3 Tax=Ceceduovirus TaxID=2842588 RepID=A0A223LG29_9CAUD|nr:hypothetical protein HWB28_gp113 [Aeromonas phage AS-zj]YP_009835048.1 hypothetical protein HWB29_gp346 [Aeromonas phage AS-sw]ASU00439.1 hypothetical protein [Aeromonas phage AS-zj]ATI17950.1 hypothetical protein [Aeromonas phage AS-yj]ATI18396.1 hypothetical protein [Aeromonas phage AS-sw]